MLVAAGVVPQVVVSGVDEDAVLATARAESADGELAPAAVALLLARAKAEAVAGEQSGAGSAERVLVLGCDSVLELDGEMHGKPGTAERAAARWRVMSGRSGVLHTGHWLVDLGGAAAVGATGSTVVHFADLSEEEIAAYVATTEPLHVAGAFTVDGLGGPYVRSIDGDYHNVVGVSLPLLRELLGELGVSWHDLVADTADRPR